MKPVRKLSRRSFLTRVAGGAIVGGGAMIAMTGGAQAFQVTDSDAGATADPPSGGRGGANRRIRGCTDGDAGASADPVGNGRGSRRTDNDPSDPPSCGRRR